MTESVLKINWEAKTVAIDNAQPVAAPAALVPWQDKYDVSAAKSVGSVDQALAPGVYKFQSGMAVMFAGAQCAILDTSGNRLQEINPNGMTRVQPKGGQPFVVIAGDAGLTFLTPGIADTVDGLPNRPTHTPDGPNWWNNLPVMGWFDDKGYTESGTPTGPYKHGGVATWEAWLLNSDGTYSLAEALMHWMPMGSFSFAYGPNPTTMATWDWVNAPQMQAYQAAWHHGEQVLKLYFEEIRAGAVAAAREEHSRSGQPPYWNAGWDESGYIG